MHIDSKRNLLSNVCSKMVCSEIIKNYDIEEVRGDLIAVFEKTGKYRIRSSTFHIDNTSRVVDIDSDNCQLSIHGNFEDVSCAHLLDWIERICVRDLNGFSMHYDPSKVSCTKLGNSATLLEF